MIPAVGAFAAGFNSAAGAVAQADDAVAQGHSTIEQRPGAITSSSTEATDDGKICHGGPAQAVTTEFVVQSLSSDKDGYTLEVDFEARNTTERGRRAISVFELVDDRGKEAAPPRLGPVAELPDQTPASSGYVIPSGLTPGYYRLTARTVSSESAASEQEAVMASLFVRIDDTGIVPISNDDWHLLSNANEAFQLPEGSN